MPSSLLLKESTGHDTTTSFSISALNRDGTCSAFSPYKPTTVLTNLQRGNVQTQTPSVLPDDNFNVNLQDENGFTPLMWASSYGQLETVRKLILRGALVSVVGSSGENALILASASGHAAIVRELINFGASLNYKDQEGNTALMYAAYNNHSGCTQELLNAGADLTAMNETFDSAYDIAVKRRSKNAQAVMEKYMLSIMSEAKMKQ
ncbi:ankyrin repeat family A protein 2-like isoform X2 [Stegodyphus dumicola]|uniref:ankyrin repeat family A protein 2-like isoform X2 n=1 Tax=Stegodyphus dumicola TaxID=202533 RepID=UPI0015AB4FA5|nr:ankyrin repeat family A protein 2-like isoform X2 [Stegodyphus dumicola]